MLQMRQATRAATASAGQSTAAAAGLTEQSEALTAVVGRLNLLVHGSA
jgi:methyl-accepting chemotaxis protein